MQMNDAQRKNTRFRRQKQSVNFGFSSSIRVADADASSVELISIGEEKGSAFRGAIVSVSSLVPYKMRDIIDVIPFLSLRKAIK